jgi:hypothetical protein
LGDDVPDRLSRMWSPLRRHVHRSHAFKAA